jgi:cellulose biosynthesis protein BcsQ
MRVPFDDSLAVFVNALSLSLPRAAIEGGFVLRNSEGRLSFISSQQLSDEAVSQATQHASELAGAYCSSGWVVLNPTSPGVEPILRSSNSYQESVSTPLGLAHIKVIDRRIVGADWLTAPSPLVTTPARHVFASIKGGVGRTTALAVVAADLAHMGKKVLVMDLDLEAPGIGAMLLPSNELPRFGMLDGLVERSIEELDDEFYYDMVSPSPFGHGRGLVDVVPAVGRVAVQHPANVLAKLARVYVERPGENGEVETFAQQVRHFADRLASLKSYDAFLIDARAGLNESTAAALLSLGANLLLFAEDTPQTFAGYRYLLAHLARFPREEADDWVTRIRMVYAKASATRDRQQAFRDKAYDLLREFLYTTQSEVPGILEYTLDDPEAPHFALPVLRDTNYFEFDPLSVPSQLTPGLYERTYQALLLHIDPTRKFEASLAAP